MKDKEARVDIRYLRDEQTKDFGICMEAINLLNDKIDLLAKHLDVSFEKVITHLELRKLNK